MLQRSGWLARAGLAAVQGVVASAWLGCQNATDTSDNPRPTSMQMPVGTAGMGMIPPIAGGGAVVGNGPPGPVAGAPGAAGMGMVGGAGSGAPQAGMAGTTPSAAGEGGSGGSAGTAGSAEPAAGSEAPPMHEDLGMGDGKDVITIGDSWMNLILSGIEQSLERISMRDYRNYSVPGTLVLNEQIPGQYESAKQENATIKTVVMTGGGNDILTSSCADEACNPIVDDVSERLNTLMMEMGKDGVQDVVLIGYTYPSDMSKHASLDHSRMLSGMLCNTSGMPRCHYLDSTVLDLTLRDGIHPDDAGYDLIGKTVWELMQKEGMRR